MPISCTHNSSAGSEKKPLVVMEKCAEKMSRNCTGFCPGRARPLLMRQSRNGSPSPRWPRMNFGRVLLEHAGEHEADRERRGLDREAPGGAQQHGEVLGVLLVIGVDHRRMRHRGMQVDRHVERLGAREDRPVALVVDELPVGEAVDHRALEAERLDAARELVGRRRRIGGRQRREARIARRLRSRRSARAGR